MNNDFCTNETMAWGLWNKIKNGFKKAAGWVKDKVIKPVVDNVIKPFKPAITAAVSAFNPAAGAIARKVMDTAEDISDGGGFRPLGNSAATLLGSGGRLLTNRR